MVLLISIVFLVQIALANIVVIQAGWSEYLIPVTMGAMTLTILFDARIGFMATTSLAIFMGIMMGQNIDLVIVSLFTATSSFLYVSSSAALSFLPTDTDFFRIASLRCCDFYLSTS